MPKINLKAIIVLYKSVILRRIGLHPIYYRVQSDLGVHGLGGGVHRPVSGGRTAARCCFSSLIWRGLEMKYLTKAVTTNNIANETVNTYLRTGIKDDGAYWKRNNRPTLLGLIKRRALAIKQHHNSNK